MPKDPRFKQQLMRSRIAAAAARLMAEDGIEDFALAKRKAARQLGAETTHALPDNAEVEEALRAYQSLYQENEQRERIRHLRQGAVSAMEAFADWRPYLCGSVLKGTAGRYSDIDLQLFTDDGKSVEMFLVNRNLHYEVSEQRGHTGDPLRTVTVLKVDWEGIPLSLAIHPANDERIALKAAGTGRSLERAGIAKVRQILEQEEATTMSIPAWLVAPGNDPSAHG